MSIFRNTFTETVRKQLKTRQDALKSRSPKAIIQLNSRNSWVRMTSGVNVNGTSALAKNYILQGGVLLNNKLRSGVGGADKVYSNFTPSLKSYNTNAKAGTAGIKPIPGITAIDIKPKSAYGSLREVTIQFECHNLQQLEDLELLYMRPGYTALIEWGWTPYLNNDGELASSINFYDDVINGTKERDQILLDLFQRSKDHSGNYDALYGYIKNYSWTARMDGGYTCVTTLISIGEIMESLKIGWTPLDINNIVLNKGLLGLKSPLASPALSSQEKVSNIFLQDPFAKHYSKNILAGLCYELYNYCQLFPKNSLDIISTSSSGYNMITYFNGSSNTNQGGINAQGNVQAYITLESFIRILNEKVLLAAGKYQANRKPFISLSTTSNSYDDNKSESLLCLAHPLQVSIDPTVCLITNPIWAGGINTSDINAGANNGTPTIYDSQALDIYNLIKASRTFENNNPIGEKLLKYIGYETPTYSTNNAKEFVRSFTKIVREKEAKFIPSNDVGRINYVANILDDLRGNIKAEEATTKIIFDKNTIAVNDKEEADKKAEQEKLAKGDTSSFGTQYLKELGAVEGVAKFQIDDEFGVIGNIYLNIDFLYRLAINDDVKINGELKLYKYLKTLLNEVQECIGGVNNFDIHVDPVDSVARIIDVNYVDTNKRKTAYDSTFQLEMSNTSGTVRSYNIQSQIFPEQASLVAIGAQVGGGGTQASQNNTLLDFNNNLTDRIITIKDDPSISLSNNKEESIKQRINYIKTSLDKIKDFLVQSDISKEEMKKVNGSTPTNSQLQTSEYKGALRDVIRYFQGVTKSNTKNRAIIPIKISLTMDGIGGLVIGHLFKIPKDLLPKGYKEDSVGGKLLQTIIGISHKVGSGDWTTTIDAYNIISNDTKGDVEFKDLISVNPITGVTTVGASANTVVENLRLSGEYLNRAADFIAFKEGFLENPRPDTDRKLRGGYGSPILYTADKKIVNLTTSTVFTEADAKRTLIYLIQTEYAPGIIKNIGQDSWNGLNANQQAALVSYSYNVGNINKLVSSIKAKDFIKTATLIKEGPITAAGKVEEGLRLRREQEAALFSKPA
jgi:GH24 family phage-related lysozyme (muramidase)